MKRLIITITICFVVLISNSQEYFQQKVDTYIDVELDDENHILTRKTIGNDKPKEIINGM